MILFCAIFDLILTAEQAVRSRVFEIMSSSTASVRRGPGRHIQEQNRNYRPPSDADALHGERQR